LCRSEIAVIVKHMPLTAPQKSNFGRLAEYVTDPQEKNERVGTVSITNCIADQVELAALEIRNTQAQNTRSAADKTYHLMISFQAGEQPNDATLKAIEERICNVLGFAEHQRISAVHHDTDNVHIHIAINKIHPSRHTVHEPFNAYYKLAKLCEKLEREYGLESDNHTPNKTRGENRAADMEHHSDVESLLGWVRRECGKQMQEAQSWQGMHEVMRQNGLRMHERANGLVVTADNGTSVKASSIGRDFSRAKLEQRFGAFQPTQDPAGETGARRYEKKPLASRVDTVELYARYKVAQAAAGATRSAEWAKAKNRKNRLIEAAKRDGRLKRAAIKFVTTPGIAKKLMYSATSTALIAEIERIKKQYLKERQEIYTRYQRRTWADWLRQQATAGDAEALEALRGRAAATGLAGNTVTGQGVSRAAGDRFKQDSVTKKGTIIYKVGASAVRDDGDKLKVSRGADQAGLQAALRLAIERYGNRITVNGSAGFKVQIAEAAAAADLPVTFTDDAIERRRQALINPPATKENKHGNDSRRRPDRKRDEPARRAAARNAATAALVSAAGAAKPGTGHAGGHKPYAGEVGRRPPSVAKNGVRGMPELGVVQQPDRGQMLLPGDVPGHVEHQGAQPDNRVRRHLHRPGRLAATPVAGGSKPNVGRLGSSPPPASKDRLHRLSRLGAMVIGEPVLPVASVQPAQLLAPRMKVKRAGATPPPAVRQQQPPQRGDDTASAPLAAAQITAKPAANSLADAQAVHLPNQTDQIRAAEKYISEREQKRAQLFDIPKHARYTAEKERTALYAGLRQIDGQALALLRQGEEVHVLPVDEATARRLKRIPLGTQIVVTAKGAIKTKGRSR
jgi:hypothetical protein